MMASELVARRVAGDGACHRARTGIPRVDHVQAGEDAGREHDRAAGHHGANDGERLEEGGDEDDAERDARVRREDADQRLQVRFQAQRLRGRELRVSGKESKLAIASRAPYFTRRLPPPPTRLPG
jgi:hypothetical protein